LKWFLAIGGAAVSTILLAKVLWDSRRWRQTEAERRRTCAELETAIQERSDELANTRTQLNREAVERRQVEEKLGPLAAAVAHAAESIMITDAKGRITYVNPFFEQMTGYRSDEVVGQDAAVMKSGEHGEEFYDDLWRTLSSGKTWRGHFINRKKDGTRFEEEAVISPVYNGNSKVAGYVAVKRNVTQEKLLESQVRQSQKMAAIGQLAHKVAHDFTNALTTVLGNTQMAKKQAGYAEDVCTYLDRIEDSVDRVSTMTTELLAFAHPSPLNPETIQLATAVRGAEEMLRQTVPDNVELDMSASDTGGPVSIDVAQIQQAIVHLAINAVEAMPDGGTLKVKVEPAELSTEESFRLQSTVHESRRHRGDFAVLVVGDTGCGMSDEVSSHMFEPFFTTKANRKNAGLGLSTVYRIVEQHNGFVTAHTEPEKGTTFRLFFPVTQEAKA